MVDNGSDDGTVEAVEAGFPDVMMIANQENRGVSFGRNQGLRMAHSVDGWTTIRRLVL